MYLLVLLNKLHTDNLGNIYLVIMIFKIIIEERSTTIESIIIMKIMMNKWVEYSLFKKIGLGAVANKS